MTQSVRAANADLVTFDLVLDGSPAPDDVIVSRIEVDHALNRLPRAIVTIHDGDPALADFKQSASSNFVPGTEIEIKMGYHSSNASVFKGIILAQTVRLDAQNASELVLTCGDKAMKLTLTRTSAQLHDASDSDVMTKLIGDAGLAADVSSTRGACPQTVQNHASAWDFILARAEANGMVVSVAGGKVSVGAPRMDSPKLLAEFGDTISRLDLEMDATQQLRAVTAGAWDPGTQAKVTATAAEPSVNSQGNLTGSKLAEVLGVSLELQSQAALTPEALQGWADTQMLKSRLSRFLGTVGFPGTALISVGDLLALDGLGARFNGAGYVSGVRHIMESGNWETEATFGLPRDWFADTNREVTAPSAPALRPGVNGLQIAVVLKTHEDPEGERRIQVRMPLQQDGAVGMWVRLVSPYAGDNCGMEFLPEVGDEVVLGFLGGDPDAGIVLGSLHSSKRPSPIVPDEKNAIKAVVSKSRIKMSYDDDKKIFQVETPGGHVFTMSDDAKAVTLADSNGNSLKMSDSGIDISSAKDVSISAVGSVSIKGEAGVTVDSPADVTVSCTNATVKGEMAANVQGGMSAELRSGAEVTVQAPMVMIN